MHEALLYSLWMKGNSSKSQLVFADLDRDIFTLDDAVKGRHLKYSVISRHGKLLQLERWYSYLDME